MTNNTYLVVDVGGSNIRLGHAFQNQLLRVESYLCAQFENIETPLKNYIQKHAFENVIMCIAIACPVKEDKVSMTNLAWSFSKKHLKEMLLLEQLFIINDYFAVASAVPFLNKNDMVQIGSSLKPDKYSAMAVCGPGTGLGVAHLVHINQAWHVLEGEGGHMDVVVNGEKNQAVLNQIRKQFAHLPAERLLSGPGLFEIYQAVCTTNGVTADKITPEQVSINALNNSCCHCVQSLHFFCAILGSFCGNLALNLATFGGVYIAGGIVPTIIDFLIKSDFRASFEDKGTYQHYNARIPTFVITDPNPGLKGAAVYLQNKFKQV